VATFYLLPPRPLVGDHVSSVLQALFPGLDWDVARRARFLDLLGELAQGQADVFVVHREDLPDGEALSAALADGFGAEPGDEVVEVRPTGRTGELAARRWRLAEG
jgi:hypothetical protein